MLMATLSSNLLRNMLAGKVKIPGWGVVYVKERLELVRVINVALSINYFY